MQRSEDFRTGAGTDLIRIKPLPWQAILEMSLIRHRQCILTAPNVKHCQPDGGVLVGGWEALRERFLPGSADNPSSSPAAGL